LLTVLYIIVAVIVAHLRPQQSPVAPSASARARLGSLSGPWQFLSLFGVTIGGIYAGIFSPTEAAAIGSVGAIALGAIGRRLTLAWLIANIESSVKTSASLFVLIIGANVFSYFIVQTQLPTLLADAARILSLPGLVVMILVIIAYIVMGCFLEGIGMILITVSGLPAAGQEFRLRSGVVRHHRGHRRRGRADSSSVGMNLFVIQAQAPDVKIGSIYRGILPFLIQRRCC